MLDERIALKLQDEEHGAHRPATLAARGVAPLTPGTDPLRCP